MVKHKITSFFQKTISCIFVFSSLFVAVGCNDNNSKMRDLKPLSDDLMLFYKSNNYSGSKLPAIGTNLAGFYFIYKNDKQRHISVINNCDELNLVGEEKYHCYYVTKEVNEIVKKRMAIPPENRDFYRGIEAYITEYWEMDDTLKQQRIMEYVANGNSNNIDFQIDNYYLIDIVKYYKERNFSDITIIDFASYYIEDNHAIINDEYQESIKYRYCYIGEIDQEPRSGKESLIRWSNRSKYNKYIFNDSLDWFSIRIEEENGKEVVKEDFVYRESFLNNDPNYYDELDECIIEKHFVKAKSQVASDYYDTVFDYEKLVGLFGFK